MKKYIDILKKTKLFKDIDEESILELLPLFEANLRNYRKGEYIFRAGETTEVLGIMLSGKAMIIQEEFWGSRNILSFIEVGQNFGEAYACAPGLRLSISVVAEAPCSIMFLNVRKAFNSDNENRAMYSRITGNLLSDMAEKNIYFTEKLTYLGERTTRAKLLAYLSGQSQKNNSVEFDIPFSRQELADYLFVERSGLSQELCKMRDEGLLVFKKNHFILKKIL